MKVYQVAVFSEVRKGTGTYEAEGISHKGEQSCTRVHKSCFCNDIDTIFCNDINYSIKLCHLIGTHGTHEAIMI